ncbi:MAG: hypothetical protein GXP43_00470 [bacterium]|nr:hypothetical protein [bacterium]
MVDTQHLLTSTLFIFLFLLIFTSITLIIISFNQPDPNPLASLKHNIPFIIIVLATLSLIISLPLNIFAREIVVTKDTFQIYLKITESPITPTPTPFYPHNQSVFSNFSTNFFTPLLNLLEKLNIF